MYKRIFASPSLSLKERMKRLIKYYFLVRGARILWERRFKKVFSIFPEYGTKLSVDVEKEHKQYWLPFRKRCNMATMRLNSNISGQFKYKYIPEEIFMSDIEPTLNNIASVDYMNYKSLYNRWHRGELFPSDYIHNIEGEWLDKDLNAIDFKAVKAVAEKLDYPVVVKPNKDSYGGKGVQFPSNSGELIEIIKDKENIIVQEKFKQHPFYNKYNTKGINSIRVNLYRSVKDKKWHVLNKTFRMGVGGSLDNETAGGIVSLINEEGNLNGFAVDKFGKKYLEHPDTKLPFDEAMLDMEGLDKAAIQVASKVFYARLVCLDLCYDSNGNWRLIEVNLNSSSIRLIQYHGALFFGDFTDEVHEYCLNNHWALS